MKHEQIKLFESGLPSITWEIGSRHQRETVELTRKFLPLIRGELNNTIHFDHDLDMAGGYDEFIHCKTKATKTVFEFEAVRTTTDWITSKPRLENTKETGSININEVQSVPEYGFEMLQEAILCALLAKAKKTAKQTLRGQPIQDFDTYDETWRAQKIQKRDLRLAYAERTSIRPARTEIKVEIGSTWVSYQDRDSSIVGNIDLSSGYRANKPHLENAAKLLEQIKLFRRLTKN